MIRYFLTGTSWILGTAALAAVGWDLAASQVPVDDNGEPLAAPESVIRLESAGGQVDIGTSATTFATSPSEPATVDSARAEPIPVADSGSLFSATELDDLVGPVALYPDDLLAIVLPAASYPLQIVQAARFLDALESNPTLQPDSDWDDSVVALLNYPEVIALLNEDLDWTWQLGQAFVDQQADTIAAIERFRDRAYAAGNLRSDEHQVVNNDNGIIEIEHVDDDIIYVPYYEPEQVVVYQAEPVYYYYPRAYPVYYYPYPVGYSFFRPHFWGVTTVYQMGWFTDHLHVYHHSYYGHPYFGHHYYDHYYYRRPSINIHVNYYGDRDDRYYRYRERDGDLWRPRQRHGAGPRDRRHWDRDERLDIMTADREAPLSRSRGTNRTPPASNNDVADAIVRPDHDRRNGAVNDTGRRLEIPENGRARDSGPRSQRPERDVVERRSDRDRNRPVLEDREQARVIRRQQRTDDPATARRGREQASASSEFFEPRNAAPVEVRRNNVREELRSSGASRNAAERTRSSSSSRQATRRGGQNDTALALRPRSEPPASFDRSQVQPGRVERPAVNDRRSSPSAASRSTIESRRAPQNRIESMPVRERRETSSAVNRPRPQTSQAARPSVERSAASNRQAAPKPASRPRAEKPAPRANSASAPRKTENRSESRRRSRDRD